VYPCLNVLVIVYAASHKQESNHQWWFSCRSGSSTVLVDLVAMCRPPMCHCIDD
jgi:hypothetical protein